MFKKFMDKFSNKKNPSNHPQHTDECIKTLRHFKHNNYRLNIRVDGHQQIFQSTVIAIDRLNKRLVMDELFPKIEFKIKENTRIHCEFHEKGTLISFQAQFISNTQANDMPAIFLGLPSNIKHDQRRNNFRLILRSGQTPSAQLTPAYSPTLSGIIKDISNHGLRINIQGNENSLLKKGDILKSCQILLDKNKAIVCQLTVRSKHYYNRPYRHTQIGTEITDIQLSDRKLLSQYVIQQQRFQCQLKATDRL